MPWTRENQNNSLGTEKKERKGKGKGKARQKRKEERKEKEREKEGGRKREGERERGRNKEVIKGEGKKENNSVFVLHLNWSLINLKRKNEWTVIILFFLTYSPQTILTSSKFLYIQWLLMKCLLIKWLWASEFRDHKMNKVVLFKWFCP